jgi:transcriptional regulator with XRE-family HTH domain/quercetin dioxygenase-like cupin family protein
MSDTRAARAGSPGRNPAPADLADGIGRRVAAHRERRGLRVAEFAREIGVSPSLISQIERGQARPSVSTLFAMAQALDVPVDAFFREQEPDGAAGRAHRSRAPGPASAAGWDGPGEDTGDSVADGEQRYVVRRGSRAAIDIEGGVRWERLTPRTLPHLDFMQLVYGPRAQSNPSLYTHPGTEMVLVTTGILDITVGFERYRLAAGDSMHFPSSMPHQYVNPTDETTRAVTVILYDCPGDPGTTGSST